MLTPQPPPQDISRARATLRQLIPASGTPLANRRGAVEMMAAPMTVGDRVLVEGMTGEIAFLGDDLPGA